jgi:phage gp46-like protein
MVLKISNSPLGGLDLVFNEREGRFVLDDSLNSDMLVSIFFEKRITLTTIRTIRGVGGWAGNNDLSEADIQGSTVWYEIQNRRLSESTKILLETAVYAALSWTLEEGLVESLDVEVDIDKSKGSSNIKVSYREISRAGSISKKLLTINV